MRILSLQISNILSIEQAEITFANSGLVLIEGWNFDTDRANGAGKTAILNSISFALYDKVPRKITASEILKRGSKSGYAEVSVLCGEDTWTVKRSRPKGVFFFKNNIEQSITQIEFESVLRLSYEQFLLTIYTPQANSTKSDRFLFSPDADKKTFLLQLLNLEKFSLYKKNVDDKIKNISQKIDLLINKLNSNTSKIEAYRESLLDKEEVLGKIEQLEEFVLLVEKELHTNLSVPKPDLSKFSKIEEDIRNKQSHFTQLKTRRNMLTDQHKELSYSLSEYDPLIKCHECGSSLASEEGRVAHLAHQDKIKQKLTSLKEVIDNCDTALMRESSVADLANKLKEKKTKESANFQSASINAANLKSLLERNKIQKDNLSTKVKNNEDLLSKIGALDKANSELSTVISSEKDNLQINKILSMVYSPTGAQAYVLDSIIDSFNEVVHKYVDLLSPDMSYILNSYKETIRGDITAKFSETLTKNGAEISIGSLSGGEQKSLSLCIDFALLEVLETQFGMSLNPIMLDEPFDGLDVAGREIVLDLLSELSKNRQIYVIDHASELKTLFSKVVLVHLRNGTSSISLE